MSRIVRDYVADMQQFIDEQVGSSLEPLSVGPFSVALAEKLRQVDPQLLRGWLNLQASSVLASYLSKQDRAQRNHNRQVAGRQAFRKAADQHEQGDSTALTTWLTTQYVVNEDGERKDLGRCRRSDLTFVADGYTSQSRRLSMEAAFFRALAKKVGDDSVAQHFTEDQLNAIRQSLHV